MVRHYFDTDHAATAAATCTAAAKAATITAAATSPSAFKAPASSTAHAAVVSKGLLSDGSPAVQRMRGMFVDDVLTPAELECMCAEHEDVNGLLEALESRLVGGQRS